MPTAADWNRHDEVSQWWHGSQRIPGSADLPQFPPASHAGVYVLIRNTTVASTDKFDAFSVNDVLIEPGDNQDEFDDFPIIDGDKPASSDEGNFALALEPLASNAIGRAIISGVTPAIVNVSDSSHMWCDVANNSHRLVSKSMGGGARILYKESGTGDKRCLIRFVNKTEETAGDTIIVRNDTGVSCPQWGVLGLDGSIYDAATALSSYLTLPPTFKGIYTNDVATRSEDHLRWCVAQEAIANGATGVAKVTGVTPIKVDKVTNHLGMPYVNVDTSNDQFEGVEAFYGSATVLDSQDSGSDRYAICKLHGMVTPLYKATAVDAIAAGGSGTCRIGTYSTLPGDGEEVEVDNKWMEGTHAISIDDELTIYFNIDSNAWNIVAAEC